MNGRRSAGFLDHFALWASLGASLYLMPFASLLVPALSIEQALLATAVAALLGGLMIASVAAVSAGTGRTSLELLSAPLGDAGRWPVAILLLVRHLLFAAFALVLITDSAELLSERSLGAGLRPLWAITFGSAALALIAAGPQRIDMVMRRAGVWLILLIALAITASAYAEFEIPAYLRRPPSGGWPSFWQAVDLMLIFPLAWLPVVADFARRGSDSGSAAWGSFAGIFVASLWFGALGILYLPATDSGDIPGFLVGMQLGIAALVPLCLLQIDELYFSSRAAVPAAEPMISASRARQVPVALLVIAVPSAIVLGVADLEGYVSLAAAVFIPGFAVVLAQALVPGPRPAYVGAIAWAGGFVVYQWITPAEIGWWDELLGSAADSFGLTFPLSESVTWLGAAIPAFAFTFCIDFLGLLGSWLFRREARAQETTGLH